MVNGRGAWNNTGLGGTKKYKSTAPGPYYYLGSGEGDLNDPNVFAVHHAVKAYQRAVARKVNKHLNIDGIFGDRTSALVTEFQKDNPEVGVWGGIGPETSKALLYSNLVNVWSRSDRLVPLKAVSGTVKHESLWDAGAVGFLDPNDVGLAQINAEAHPQLTKAMRLKPLTSFNFIINYHEENLDFFNGNLRDAIAAYNLGKGGASSWIRAGRPDFYTPSGSNRARDVKGYIDAILAG